jgi:hypothetical protein
MNSLKKKKLLIVVGAGASLEFGMPSVSDIDVLFERWACEKYSLADNSRKSLYTCVKENIQNYLLNQSKNGFIEPQNFEKTLYYIQNIASFSEDHYWSSPNPMNAFLKFNPFPELKNFNTTRIAKGMDFQRLNGLLVDRLLKYFRKKCIELPTIKSEEIKKLRSFFEVLKQDFEIGFINLNYDNVILSTLPDLFTGFNKENGEFDLKNFYTTTSDFCYHLHGSVHFDMGERNAIDDHPIYWQNDLLGKFNVGAANRRTSNSGNGLLHLNSSIITGLDKPNQLLKVPFKQFFGKVDELIYQSDSILFMGYGFGDRHLNKTFPIHRVDSNKIKKVTVIDWARDNDDGLFDRANDWSIGLSDALKCYDFIGTGLVKIPPKVGYYKNRKSLEVSKNKLLPLSIWYNGLLEACENPDIIRESLK